MAKEEKSRTAVRPVRRPVFSRTLLPAVVSQSVSVQSWRGRGGGPWKTAGVQREFSTDGFGVQKVVLVVVLLLLIHVDTHSAPFPDGWVVAVVVKTLPRPHEKVN